MTSVVFSNVTPVNRNIVGSGKEKKKSHAPQGTNSKQCTYRFLGSNSHVDILGCDNPVFTLLQG